MIRSMTGYGKAEAVLSAGTLTIEIRALNGKNADINLKSSLLPREKELEVRKWVADALRRGTIDIFLSFEPGAGSTARPLNQPLIEEYLRQLRTIIDGQTAPSRPEDHAPLSPEGTALLLGALLRLPDVTDTKKADSVGPDEWPLVAQAFHEAIERLDAFRLQEGQALYRDVTGRVATILHLYDEVETLEGERMSTIQQRLRKNLADLQAQPDPNRFEQELIFYLEKYDINEEKVRLRQHCNYFMETIDTDPYPGKKLGFIIQEMGREINTTGSKANHALMQQHVVRMKDELEKIREQSLNIL